ncbi:MAG: Sec-independent protein translocase protein TatB [Acidobacteria bacterium]|nr:Sec-independent protein translocase protein TatB [Acidobacteriota bacterium]
MVLLFLESIGTTELLVILVVALVVFGPRRLPELGRKLAKGMSEFRRVSDDFKRTWEREVDLERYDRERTADRALLTDEETPALARAEDATDRAPAFAESAESVARGTSPAAYDPEPGAAAAAAGGASVAASAEPAEASPRKSDWL